MSLDAIKAAIPHREPFLLLDEIVEQSENRIVCRKTFHGRRVLVSRATIRSFPLTPGVLLVRGGDASRGGAARRSTRPTVPGGVPVVTRMNNVKFKHMVRPGDTIELAVELTERMAGAFFLSAEVKVGGKTAVTFDFACKLAQPRK